MVGLGLLVWITLQTSLASFDMNMYPGVDVVGQDGQTLLVTLDDELLTGTDGACYEMAYVLKNIAIESGYDIQVIAQRNEWVPFNGRSMSAVELINVIESGTPY